jgi:hypothetical protein
MLVLNPSIMKNVGQIIVFNWKSLYKNMETPIPKDQPITKHNIRLVMLIIATPYLKITPSN